METVGGHADTINLAWDLVRQQGTVAVLGIFPRPLPINLLAPVMREAWVTFPNCYGVIDGRHDYDVAIEMIAGGQTQIERLVTSRSRCRRQQRRSRRPPTSHAGPSKST